MLAPQIAQFHRLLESTGTERVEDLGIPASVLQEVSSLGSEKRAAKRHASSSILTTDPIKATSALQGARFR